MPLHIVFTTAHVTEPPFETELSKREIMAHGEKPGKIPG
jgi:hypothetical protein